MLLVRIVDCALGHLFSPSIESCILDCQLRILVFILRFLFLNALCIHTRVTVVCYQSTACLRRLCSKGAIKLSFTNYRFTLSFICISNVSHFLAVHSVYYMYMYVHVTSLVRPRAYLLIGEVLLIVQVKFCCMLSHNKERSSK